MADAQRRLHAGWQRKQVNKKELADVMDFVMLNHEEICDRWKRYFHGDISFYR